MELDPYHLFHQTISTDSCKRCNNSNRWCLAEGCTAEQPHCFYIVFPFFKMLSIESFLFILDLKRKQKGWKQEVCRSRMLFLIIYMFISPSPTLSRKRSFKAKWLYANSVKVSLITFCHWVSEDFLFIDWSVFNICSGNLRETN